MWRFRLPNVTGGEPKWPRSLSTELRTGLAARERLVTAVRLHPAARMAVILQTFVVVAFALALRLFSGSNLLTTPALWIALIMLVRLLWKIFDWSVERVMITDKRIIKTSGILTRRIDTMPLAKVTDLTYKRDLFGRILGYGTFIVESAGQDQALRKIDYLPRPNRLYLTLCDMMFPAPGDGGAPVRAPAQANGGD